MFHENRQLADDSREISYIIPYLFRKLRKMSQNLLSAAVVIGAVRVKRGISHDLYPQMKVLNMITPPPSNAQVFLF